MPIKSWREVIDIDLPEAVPVTEKTREQIVASANNPRFRGHGSMRIATGRFYTDREFERLKIKTRYLPEENDLQNRRNEFMTNVLLKLYDVGLYHPR